MMKKVNHFILAVSSLLFCITLHAEVVVTEAWTRATVPQQKVTGVFFQIQAINGGRLLSVHTNVAGKAEIHEMKMENNVMKMRALDYLDLPAGKLVELKPGGYHVMLTELAAQIKPGDIIVLNLTVEGKDKQRESIEVQARAKPINSADGKM